MGKKISKKYYSMSKKISKKPNHKSSKRVVMCYHDSICIVTEIPTNGKYYHPERQYVKYILYEEILPIRRVIQETIKVHYGIRGVSKN